MASHLTFTSSTVDDHPGRWQASSPGPEEFQCLANALVQRLREGSMPPDDAYWWTRALCAEPFMKEPLAEYCRVA
jgi:hypothetical protein